MGKIDEKKQRVDVTGEKKSFRVISTIVLKYRKRTNNSNLYIQLQSTSP